MTEGPAFTFAGSPFRTGPVGRPELHLTWRPIADAPKDGTPILARGRDDTFFRVWWGRNHRDEPTWCSVVGGIVDGYLTDYVPMPLEREPTYG